MDRIVSYSPDLVITFSDVQAGIAAELIRAGCTVLSTNQRSVSEITRTIRLIGRAVDCAAAAEDVVAAFRAELFSLASSAHPKPRVYFEEWPDPPVSGIGWVGEIIELAGGIDVFADRRGPRASDRVVTLTEVVAARPEIILASWCGKPVDFDSIRDRPAFSATPAVATGQIFALDSGCILQPGPRVLQGFRQIREIFDQWRTRPDANL